MTETKDSWSVAKITQIRGNQQSFLQVPICESNNGRVSTDLAHRMSEFPEHDTGDAERDTGPERALVLSTSTTCRYGRVP